jgi:hypothetical protein
MARFIVSNNDNTFDVIEGRQLNDKPLNRAEADRLARRSRGGCTEEIDFVTGHKI